MERAEALELLGTHTADQWGMVTTAQAKALGVDAATLRRLERVGHLDRVRRGVYATTTATVTDARDEQAAWLWLDPARPAWERPALDLDGGVVSHQSAARLYRLGDLVADRVTLTTPRRRTSRDPDLRLITRQLADQDVTTVDGLPVTTALRTIVDLLDLHLDGGHIATVIRQAVEANLVGLDTLAERLGPYALRYGVRRPGDGEALLEHLLTQIGTSTAQLAQRPAPPRTEAALAMLSGLGTPALAAVPGHSARLAGLFRGMAALAGNDTGPDPAALALALYADRLRPLGEIVNAQQFAAALAVPAGVVRETLQALRNPALTAAADAVRQLQQELVALSAGVGQDAAADAVRQLQQGLVALSAAVSADAGGEAGAGVGDDEAHGTAAPAHTEELHGLPEGQGPQQDRGDGHDHP